MSHIFCRCGYLPRTTQIPMDLRMLGSVPTRPHQSPDYCQAIGFQWGWHPVRCPNDVEASIEGVPLCKRHLRVAQCPLPNYSRSVEERWKARTARYAQMPLQLTDGGRRAAGFKNTQGDCVYCAIAIAEQRPYAEVAEALFSLGASKRRKGCARYIYEAYLLQRGWQRVKAPRGMYLRKGMLPNGRLLVVTAGHMVAVIDGTLHDSYDSSRHGTRRVVCYYSKEVQPEVTK